MASVTISPRKITTGLLSHAFVSNANSRSAIKVGLEHKIQYDMTTVFDRLKIDLSRREELAGLVHLVLKECKGAISKLKLIVSNAQKQQRKPTENQGKSVSTEERLMYTPLTDICNFIAHSNADELASPTRIIHNPQGPLKAPETTPGFSDVSPDLAITPMEKRGSLMWHDQDAFGEVKPSKQQGPKPVHDGVIPEIVVQAADYARHFFAARPQMLFCVGLMIFGTEFCVGIFDRDGITFSPIFDMFEDTDVFILVIRSLTCETTIADLGLDPSVSELSEKVQKTLGLDEQDLTYPSVIVNPIGADMRKWCTIGRPLWSTHSLLGRGTNVWKVRSYVEDKSNECGTLTGETMVMKTAWRNSARSLESDIYQSLIQPPKRLARFETGGDVQDPNSESGNEKITVHGLRRNESPMFEGETTPVLHRIILSTLGRALSSYTSEIELLTGVSDALKAHKELCDRGVLHRDISPGNVMITVSKDDNGRCRGFIADLELARIEHSTLTPAISSTISIPPTTVLNDKGRAIRTTERTTRTKATFGDSFPIKRGLEISGTAQFASRRIIRSTINSNPPVTHLPGDDVESFIWVFSYSVMRGIHEKSSISKDQHIRKQRHLLLDSLKACFGAKDAKELNIKRTSSGDTLEFPLDDKFGDLIAAYMSPSLKHVFRMFQGFISDRLRAEANDMYVIPLLTHEELQGVFNTAVKELEENLNNQGEANS